MGKDKKECLLCKRKVVNLNLHMKTHVQPKKNLYECQLCNSKMADREALILHTENAHKSVSDNQCRMCNFIFLDQIKLDYHLKMSHNLNPKQHETLIQNEDIQEIVKFVETQHNQSNVNSENNKIAKDDEMFKLKCTIHKQSNLINSFIQVSQILCKNIESANLVTETSHMKNKHKNDQKCDICQNNSVFSVSGLKRHRKMVHNIISENEPKIPAQNNKSVINVQENVLTENIGTQGLENELGTVKTETKTKKPTIKELQKYIFGLEDQLKTSNNENTKLTKEIEVRTAKSDLENERIRSNLRRVTTQRNNVMQNFNEKSSELTLINTKWSESKKKCVNQQAQILILKTKLKLLETKKIVANTNNVHEGKKPVRCDNELGLIFQNTENSKTEHDGKKSSVHEGKKPFRCDNQQENRIENEEANDIIVHEITSSKRKKNDLNSAAVAQELPTTTTSTTNKNSLSCPMCSKIFSRRANMSVHISAVHEGKKPFKCDACGKCFSEKGILKRHFDAVHDENKPRKEKPTLDCHICGKKFTQSGHVRTHISSVHENSRKFECTDCQKTFNEITNLTKHIAAVHEKKKPFMCTSCPKAFGNKSNLKVHEKTHKKEN